ncbi:glucosaminidase domain-containing protein [Cellvibrio sp. UBA7661]|uniref:glucosaminidase domain-containing protein n=1 Tax=Cellvibrio sp. UBA7661 TaxID=1946311 RepID=UPI002F359DCA
MSALRISYSVGENGKNYRSDVFVIQKALNLVIKSNMLAPLIPLKEDGVAGQKTKAAIRRFQQVLVRFPIPDGRIDPTGKTLEKLNSTILTAKQDASISKTSKIESMLTPSTLLAGTFGSQNNTSQNFDLCLSGAVSESVDLKSLTKEEFVRRVFEAAKKEELSSGVPAAVTAAQAILETGYGGAVPTDINTKKYSYNLFGIKGVGTAGSVNVYTHEVIDGKRIKIIDKFQAYNSFAESISGRTTFLKRNIRYKSLFNSKDPKVWAEGLQKAGYATDPNYAKTLISIMNSWRLI